MNYTDTAITGQIPWTEACDFYSAIDLHVRQKKRRQRILVGTRPTMTISVFFYCSWSYLYALRAFVIDFFCCLKIIQLAIKDVMREFIS